MRVIERAIGGGFGSAELDAIRAVYSAGTSPSWGPERDKFERDFREFCGARHAVALGSCTAALNICAKLLRLGAGDEVIVTPQTFWSTVAALVERKVTVKFGDVDPNTLNLTPESIERLVTPRTRAIYVTHYAGNPADLDAITDIARANGLPVVEDCAHAIGASYKNRLIGSGDLCCFSFQSLKNISTLGEGGLLTTNSDQWAAEATALRSMGIVGTTQPRRRSAAGPYPDPEFPLYDHSTFPAAAGACERYELLGLEEIGTKSYLSAVQAAVGSVQLRRLPEFNARRARIAQRYSRAIESIEGLRAPYVPESNVSAWHLYTCFLDPNLGITRNDFIHHLQEICQVQILLRYWPLHLTSVMQSLGHAFGESPVCERVWFEQQVNLPIAAGMEDGEVDLVIEALADAIKHVRRRATSHR